MLAKNAFDTKTFNCFTVAGLVISLVGTVLFVFAVSGVQSLHDSHQRSASSSGPAVVIVVMIVHIVAWWWFKPHKRRLDLSLPYFAYNMIVPVAFCVGLMVATHELTGAWTYVASMSTSPSLGGVGRLNWLMIVMTPVVVVLPDLLVEACRLDLFPDELDNAEARDRGGGWGSDCAQKDDAGEANANPEAQRRPSPPPLPPPPPLPA